MSWLESKKLHLSEKQNNNKNILQDGKNYIIDINWKDIKFKFDNFSNFKNFVDITKKILEIYKNNNEDGKFYIDKDLIWKKEYEDLVLDNSIFFDTTYLQDSSLSSLIWKENINNYILFLNTIKDNKSNINYLTNIEQNLENEYKNEINKLYNKYWLTLYKSLDKNRLKSLYFDFRDYILNDGNNLNINLLKNYYNTLDKSNLDEDILFSVVFLKTLLKKWYNIKYEQYSWNFDINDEEFKYLKNILPKNIKVNYNFENQNSWTDIRNMKFSKIKFKKEWNEIKIIWITKDKKINIWNIELNNFYSKLLD